MSTNTVEVVLQGIDKASTVFADAGASAERAMGDASKSVDGLSTTVDGVPDVEVSTANAQAQLEQAQGVVGNLGEEVESTRGLFDRLKDGAGQAGDFIREHWDKIAVGSGVAGAAMEGFARKQGDINYAFERMGRVTGQGSDEMRDMATELQNVTFPMEDVTSLMETATQRGLSGEGIKEYANFWDMVGDATGEAGPELGKAGIALEMVGISAENQGEALDAFGYITDNTTGTIEEFLRFTERAGKELGDNTPHVDDMAAALASLEGEGYSARIAQRELQSALRETDGDMDAAMQTLGVSSETYDGHRKAVEGSGVAIEENAAAYANSLTPLEKLSAWTENLMVKFGGLADLASLAAPVLIGLAGAVSAVRGAMQLAGMAGGPIMLVVAAVAALVAGLVIAYKESEKFRAVVDAAWQFIKDVFIAAWDQIKPVLDALRSWLQDVVPPVLAHLREVFEQVWQAVAGVVIEAWQTHIYPALLALGDFLRDSIPPALQKMREIFDIVWGAVKGAIAAAWSYIQPVFNTLQDVLAVVLPIAFGILKDVALAAWSGIQAAIQLAWAVIRGVFNTIRQIIQNVLAPVFTWLWKNIIGPAFAGIGLLIKAAWNGVIKPIFDIIRSVVTNILGPAFTWFYNSVIKPVWDKVSSAIRAAWDFVKPIFDRFTTTISKGLGPTFRWLYDSIVKPVFGWVGDKISSVWRGVIKPAFDAIKDGVKAVGTRFDDTVKNIGKAWDKIKKIAAKPIHFVLDRVINRGLIKGFNKLVDWIPGVKGLKKVGVPGWLKNYGFAEGGYTGPGSKYTPAGVVHADEYVLNKEATRSLRRTVGLSGLDYMNQTGQFPGYDTGGLVRPVNGKLTSRFGPRWGSFHSGIDYAVPTGTNVRAALAGTVARAKWNAVTGRTGLGMLLSHPGNRNTYYGHLSKVLAKVGDKVAKGQAIAKSGNTGNSTGPHLHFETWTGGKPVNPLSYMGGLPSSADGGVGGDGGGFDIFAPFKKIGESIKGWFTSKFPDGGIIVDAAVNAATGSFDKIADWVKSKIPGMGGDGGGSSAAKDAVRQVAERYGWDKGDQWAAIERIVQKESSWNMDAKNPSSSARGLFQKMTSIHGAIEKTAAGQAQWGLKYIKDRYATPRTALDFHNRNNYYDNGGVLPSGLTMAMNATGGPEAILTRPQWAAMSALADYAAVHLADLDASPSTGHGDEHAGVTRIENKYYFNVEIDASDLEDVADIKEFFETLKRQAKEKRAHERGTKRSGKVNA